MNVLYVDDEVDSQQIVNLILEEHGMQVIFADTGAAALEIWHTQPINLVLLDVVLPDMTGVEVCRYIRSQSDIAVILLSARGQAEEILEGFNAGANDYLIKPIRTKELIARIQAVLGRATIQEPWSRSSFSIGSLTLDLESQQIARHKLQVAMSPIEFRLLKYLIQNAGQVISKESLLRNVWGYAASTADMNLIEASVRRLRKKLEDDPGKPQLIQTVWGAGYRFGD